MPTTGRVYSPIVMALLLPRRSLAIATCALWLGPTSTYAQRLVTRADAVGAALASGSRIALARADTAAARARALTARALPNPSLAASYSKSAPQKHLSLEIPFDAPWVRSARVRAASASSRAARLRFLSERAAAYV